MPDEEAVEDEDVDEVADEDDEEDEAVEDEDEAADEANDDEEDGPDEELSDPDPDEELDELVPHIPPAPPAPLANPNTSGSDVRSDEHATWAKTSARTVAIDVVRIV